MTDFFQHPQALVESANIGAGTRVWAFAHILPGAVLGNDCNICDHVFIENDVQIGDRVTLKCGVQIWDGITLGNDVFVGPNATFTNDKFPRSKVYPEKFLRTQVGDGASIGANATILPGVHIGAGAMIGAGAVVTQNVLPGDVVVGNPAKVMRRSNQRGGAMEFDSKQPRMVELPKISDPRGNLTSIEALQHIPFAIQRVYYLYDVPAGEARGGHGHKQLEQLLVAVSGSFDVVLDDGVEKKSYSLNRPYVGLYVPRMIWREIENFSSGSVCLVLASEHYDEADYFRHYEDFLKASKS